MLADVSHAHRFSIGRIERHAPEPMIATKPRIRQTGSPERVRGEPDQQRGASMGSLGSEQRTKQAVVHPSANDHRLMRPFRNRERTREDKSEAKNRTTRWNTFDIFDLRTSTHLGRLVGVDQLLQQADRRQEHLLSLAVHLKARL